MKSIRHFCTLLVAALLFTFGTSCGQREQPTSGVGEVGAGAQPLAQKAVDPDHATAEVIVAWKGVPFGSALSASATLTATITSPSGEAKEGRLSLVASGLDGQLQERDLGKFSVSGGDATEVSFAPEAIPLQSEIATSFVVVQAELARPDGHVVRTGTQPLYYRFEKDYETVLLHHVDDVAFLPNGGTLVTNTMDVRGRILDANHQWRALPQADAKLGPTLGLTGVRAVAASPSDTATETAAGGGVVQPPATPLSAAVTICSTWRVQYVDSGFGEDGFPTSAWTDVPASLARAWVLSVPGNAVYWQGQLDVNGCTPGPVTLPAGTFRLQQSTTQIGMLGVWFNNYYVSGGVPYEYQIWADFSSSGSGSSTVTVHPTFNNDAIQAAAVASRVVMWHFVTAFWGGGGLGLVNGRYTVRANEGCGPPLVPPTDSCYDPVAQVVHLGTTVVGGYGDAHWKFVIAHETGHMVQDRAMGFFSYNYNAAASERLCNCNYSTQWGNTSHCLQSREDSGGAQIEGFGHAFGSRVFNSPFEANGKFVYYKPFEFYPYAFLYPPVGRDAFATVHWMETYCLASARGTEFDWLTFEYNISSYDRSSPTALPQLFEIYKRACTGNPSVRCGGQNVQWETLRSAAQTHYGSIDPRYLRFRDTGQDFGVDH